MTFDPEPDLSESAVTDRVDATIDDNDVVLFMKGTPLMPQCGYSRRALGLIDQYRDEFETVNVLDALDAYRSALKQRSDWETIPQAYVEGEFIGGSDILAELDERGELQQTLTTDSS
ncbi:glutaredoxin family protein [Halocatena pleomorpha]|uniref:Glutaredoxin n=1 Tax=Halocatena pleomorpha TaxID=1785090 RepID=A0A3P3RF61_9EURY|nr:glutaredoxin family protein [Halocatena pleomorpha]RRJ32041.1 glutaredoxin [Halocatena pleomorpha]